MCRFRCLLLDILIWKCDLPLLSQSRCLAHVIPMLGAPKWLCHSNKVFVCHVSVYMIPEINQLNRLFCPQIYNAYTSGSYYIQAVMKIASDSIIRTISVLLTTVQTQQSIASCVPLSHDSCWGSPTQREYTKKPKQLWCASILQDKLLNSTAGKAMAGQPGNSRSPVHQG